MAFFVLGFWLRSWWVPLATAGLWLALIALLVAAYLLAGPDEPSGSGLFVGAPVISAEFVIAVAAAFGAICVAAGVLGVLAAGAVARVRERRESRH